MDFAVTSAAVCRLLPMRKVAKSGLLASAEASRDKARWRGSTVFWCLGRRRHGLNRLKSVPKHVWNQMKSHEIRWNHMKSHEITILVGALKPWNLIFHFIWMDVILPIDELHHFSRWCFLTTNQNMTFQRGRSTTYQYDHIYISHHITHI